MNPAWTISSAKPEERDAALHVAFADLPADERAVRSAHVHDLITMGEIDAQGIFVARNAGAIHGVFVCVPMPGATAVVWAPRGDVFASAIPASRSSSGPIDDANCGDRLIEAGLQWLRKRGIKIAQAIVAPEDADALIPLASHAFVAAGPMLFFRHGLAAPPQMPAVADLRIEPMPRADSNLFARTLERTYEGTLDFPELSNIRSVDEILKSYRANPLCRPEHWRLALLRGEPAGVLMLTELEPLGGWDLTYVGVVPQQRQKGVGRALVEAALHAVADSAGAHLDVAVDARNLPALQLYARHGFQLLGERRVCLCFLNPE